MPLEQALRSLTHWFNVRRYPDKMGGEEVREAMREEQDFFVRELDKIDWNWADVVGGGLGGGLEGYDDGTGVGGREWEGEGW